ncbi:MAG: hypothetical protein J7K04_03715 [Spirochaetales bacterium]|nr:hypothetical protein [Spirochaetales bacterium]
MLQKPPVSTLRDLAVDYLFYIDLGLWLLSDRAIDIILKKSGWQNDFPTFYDLYGTFGFSLGRNPRNPDPDIASLSTTIINLSDGEFYHLGTSREIISSSLALQNKVMDQSVIWTRNVKLPRGVSLDISPIKGSNKYVVRPYGFNDSFRGAIGNRDTKWMNISLLEWLARRGLDFEICGLSPATDIQEAALFPLVSLEDDIEALIRWMINCKACEDKMAETLWLES